MKELFDDRERTLRLLRGLIAFCVASTAIHYSHNFLSISDYPSGAVSDTATQIAIIVSWPLFTAIGLVGYRLYARGRYHPAHICLASYSVLGITTLGHFLYGAPDIPLVFFVTIFTDGIAGFAILAFTLLSVRARRSEAGEAEAARAARLTGGR